MSVEFGCVDLANPYMKLGIVVVVGTSGKLVVSGGMCPTHHHHPPSRGIAPRGRA